MNHNIDTLNQRFDLAGALHFVEVGTGLPVAEITTPQACAPCSATRALSATISVR